MWPPEKAMAPHSGTLAWKIPWMEEPVGCSPWGCKELDTAERLHFHFSLSCIGEGNSNPLQCSCLENPRNRGDWWAAFYGVAQSQTQLKWLSSSSSSYVTPWTVAQQVPLLMGFSKQACWSGLPCPPPVDLPKPGIESRSPALQEDSLPSELLGKSKNTGVGSLSLLQSIFPTQELNQGLLPCMQILYQLSYQGNPGSFGGDDNWISEIHRVDCLAQWGHYLISWEPE